MSGHLHDDTSLYYITSFIGRYINKTSSLLLKDTGHSPPCYRYYYTPRMTTNILTAACYIVRRCLHDFIKYHDIPLMREYHDIPLMREYHDI